MMPSQSRLLQLRLLLPLQLTYRDLHLLVLLQHFLFLSGLLLQLVLQILDLFLGFRQLLQQQISVLFGFNQLFLSQDQSGLNVYLFLFLDGLFDGCNRLSWVGGLFLCMTVGGGLFSFLDVVPDALEAFEVETVLRGRVWALDWGGIHICG